MNFWMWLWAIFIVFEAFSAGVHMGKDHWNQAASAMLRLGAFGFLLASEWIVKK